MSKKIDKAVFIPTNKYISFFSGTPKIFSWISKRMSDESIKIYLQQIIVFLQGD